MSDIEFGLILPQGWLNDLLDYDYIRRFAQEADNLGFSLWAYDHFIPHYRYKPLKGKPMLECFTLLASVASITSKARIGEVVACNSYRNPSMLAKMISTLDFISNGRAVLGIGAGWYEEEYIAYGYPFPSAKVRIEQLDEALTILKRMLKEGECIFNGKYYNVNAFNYPKAEHVPVMVGGYGRMLLNVAAKHADIYNCPFVSVHEYKGRLEILREHCSSIGRDIKEVSCSLLTRVIVSSDSRLIRGEGEDTIAGDVEHVYHALEEYVSIGVKHFILHIQFDKGLEQLRLVSKVCRMLK